MEFNNVADCGLWLCPILLQMIPFPQYKVLLSIQSKEKSAHQIKLKKKNHAISWLIQYKERKSVLVVVPSTKPEPGTLQALQIMFK